MNTHIAVDIGGTQLRAACYQPGSHTPIQIARTSTQGGGEDPVERLMRLIASIWPSTGRVAAIGAAAPGPLDPYRGILISAPNIPGWENLPLRELLEDRFGVPVALGNDANLAALGEWKVGAGQGHHHMLYLTVSTGIGGGVIVDDRLLLGQRGMAGELGHTSVMVDGPLCGCGQRGHLETVASGTAIARWVREQLDQGVPSSLPADQPVTARLVSQAAQQGDPLAIAALGRAGRFLGRAVADFLHIFNPSAVIIGGGVSRSGPFLFEPLCAAIREYAMSPHYYLDLELKTAALGDEAGLMGALTLARALRPE